MRCTCSAAHVNTDLAPVIHEYTNVTDREVERRVIADTVMRVFVESGPQVERGRRVRIVAERRGLLRDSMVRILARPPLASVPPDHTLEDIDVLVLRGHAAVLRELWPAN